MIGLLFLFIELLLDVFNVNCEKISFPFCHIFVNSVPEVRESAGLAFSTLFKVLFSTLKFPLNFIFE